MKTVRFDFIACVVLRQQCQMKLILMETNEKH